MMHIIVWENLIIQLIIFLIIIGIPITVLVSFLKRRKSKIKELEQRIEELEREQKHC